jgi:hypothetical protein
LLFAWDITVPALTLATAPLTQTLKLSYGIITKIDIKFPAGCHGLVNIRLLHEESPLIPNNKDTWLTGDNETVAIPEYFELTTTPYALKFVGISPGTAYAHTISVRITILPKTVASLLPLLDIFTRIAQRMGLM